jgi:hypothetical protein
MTDNGDETVLAAALQRITEALERKCPEVESSEFLCDRPAQYPFDGMVLCATHVRRRMEGKMSKLPDQFARCEEETEDGFSCGLVMDHDGDHSMRPCHEGSHVVNLLDRSTSAPQ